MTPEQFQIALAANRAQLAGYAGLAAALVHLVKLSACPTYATLAALVKNPAEVDDAIRSGVLAPLKREGK